MLVAGLNSGVLFMTTETLILLCGYMAGFYMAWNIGANDVANSMASAVGARAITLRQAIFIAGILNIVGATFIGAHVTETIRKGIVSSEVLSDPDTALLGSLAALLSAGLWVSLATWRSLPVSTTHSIVGAMIGFGIICGGFSVINWGKLGAVVASWVISPIFAMVLSFLMLKLILAKILSKGDPDVRALKYSPFFIGIAVFICILSFVFKTPLGKRLSLSVGSAVGLSLLLSAFLGWLCKLWIVSLMRKKGEKHTAEGIFRRIQIGTSCYVALAQGANDVANAIGPLALIYFLVKTGQAGTKVPVPFFLLFFGGLGIAVGIAMGGSRVIRTVGERITTLSNTRGFSVDFAAATTVLLASKMGLPVSTTHAAVGGVLGVGLARGMEAVNFSIIFQIIIYWILTVPAAALTSMAIYKILLLLFHL